MGYDISIRHPGTGAVLHAAEPHHYRGGTYCEGGTTELWISLTYNYAPHFYRVLGERGIRRIYGMETLESVSLLAEAARQLEGLPDPDYWAPTEGNAKAALLKLIGLAALAPGGVWDGD